MTGYFAQSINDKKCEIRFFNKRWLLLTQKLCSPVNDEWLKVNGYKTYEIILKGYLSWLVNKKTCAFDHLKNNGEYLCRQYPWLSISW